MEISRQQSVNTKFAVSPYERTQIVNQSRGNISKHLKEVIELNLEKVKKMTPSLFSKKNRKTNIGEKKINPTAVSVSLPFQIWKELENESVRLGASKSILFYYIYPFKNN